VVTLAPLTEAEVRLIAGLYPGLSTAVALATYRAWIKQGFEELDKWRFRAELLGD
jgi:hypothetical protein